MPATAIACFVNPSSVIASRNTRTASGSPHPGQSDVVFGEEQVGLVRLDEARAAARSDAGVEDGSEPAAGFDGGAHGVASCWCAASS